MKFTTPLNNKAWGIKRQYPNISWGSCIFLASEKLAEKMVQKYTGFKSVNDMLSVHVNYNPTFNTIVYPELNFLADYFDENMKKNGRPNRGWRTGTGYPKQYLKLLNKRLGRCKK